MEFEKQEQDKAMGRDIGQEEEIVELEEEAEAEMDREMVLEQNRETADIIKLQFSDLCGRLKSVEISGSGKRGWERLEAV